MTIHDAYLEKISRELKLPSQEKDCFLYRWHPRNQGKKTATVAKQLKDIYPAIETCFTTITANVGKKIISHYRLPGVEDGRKRFEETYRWLWETKFVTEAWNFCKTQAVYHSLAMKMKPITDIDRYAELDEIPEEDTIQLIQKQRYRLTVDFSEVLSEMNSKAYLLLMSEDSQGIKQIFSPSKPYAEIPVTAITANQAISIPPPVTTDAEKKFRARSLKYSDLGKEYFLAIITPQPLELSWVKPEIPGKKQVTLDEERVKEIFTKLSQQPEARAFYKEFEVIEA